MLPFDRITLITYNFKSMMKIHLQYICTLALAVTIALVLPMEGYGQTKTITGVVTDASSGSTLPGVNILIEGTRRGTSTNVDGKYSLNVSSLQDTLVFSFIGYQKKTALINGRTRINVVLQPQIIAGQQLIVVGYQKKEKSAVTGAVSQIAGTEIAQAPTVNIEKGLEGRIPGLKISNRGGEPGTPNLDILIRGRETFGDNAPLFIIDGVPSTEQDFANLAPQNIATVSVLKDASAAIYGARAANGVIMVTTKRGIKGTSIITINMSTGFSTPTALPTLMDSYQYATYKNEAEERYGRTLSYTDNDLQLYKNGSAPLTHPSTDWLSTTLRSYAPQSQIGITVQGGTNKIKYFLSGGYNYVGSLYHTGEMDFKKYQLRSNIDAQITKDLHIGFDLSGRLGKIHHPSVSAADIFTLLRLTIPMAVARYPNGLPGTGGVSGNPMILASNTGGWLNARRRLFKTKLSADLDLGWVTKGLELKGYAAFTYNAADTTQFMNVFKEYNYNSKTGKYEAVMGSAVEKKSYSQLFRGNLSGRQELYNISLRYKRSFGPHNFDGFVAYEVQEGSNEVFTGYRRDVISPQKVYLDLASTLNQTTSGIAYNTGRVSLFGSAGYNYKHKYLLQFTLRRDGSFNFPQKGRFGTFPSISAGWVITNESFMSGTERWLDNLKIRSSYGLMGNDQVPSFQYLTQYQLSTGQGYYIFGDPPQRYNGFYQTNTPNPDITWEVAKKWDIGIDASLFNSKFTLTADYFYDKRRKILIKRTGGVPEYTGLSLPQQNLGKLNNHGFELSLGYQNSPNNKWTYNFSGNVSYNKNEIIFMSEPEGIPSYQRQTGHPLASYLLYEADGIFHTQQEVDNWDAILPGTKPGDIRYIDVNEDGEINALDMVRVFSSPIPKVQYGLTAGFSYNNFTLNAYFQGQAMAKNYIAPDRGADSNEPVFYYEKRWTENNKDATYPRAMERTDFFNYANRSTFWLYSSAFVRLKNLTISYTLPDELIGKDSFKKIEVYLRGSNLLTWAKMDKRMGGKYYDPEMNTQEGSYYPQQKIYELGLSIQF